MQFEEMQDMAISSIKKSGADAVSKNSMKLMRNIKTKEDVVEYTILLMFLAGEFKMNLEDELLNKIERILKYGN